jgi:hypothetical protein
VIRSPLTGFAIVCPGVAMTAPLVWVLERVRGQPPHGIGSQETLDVRPLRYPEPRPTAMALLQLMRD